MQVINTRQEFFREIEELETTFTETIREEIQNLLSEFHDAPGGYQGAKLDDDLVILLQDKDTLLQVSGNPSATARDTSACHTHTHTSARYQTPVVERSTDRERIQ